MNQQVKSVENENGSFPDSVNDIPAGAKPLKTVRNRPYAYASLGLGVLVLFLIMAPKYWIMLTITIVLFVGILFMNGNHPVIGLYDGFIVCYSNIDPRNVKIIKDSDLIDWDSSIMGKPYVEFHYAQDGIDKHLYLMTINTFGVENALETNYDKKSRHYIQTEKSREIERQRLKEKRAQFKGRVKK